MNNGTVIFPIPKHIETDSETENKRGFILARIQYEDRFEKAADVFCGYAESQFGVKWTFGDGGVLLVYDGKLDDEEYTIHCDEAAVTVSASAHKGMSNALSCLLSVLKAEGDRFTYMCCHIQDKPDVFYRSFMLDTARYIHDMSYLYRYIDLCYMNRLSFFQIHFTDDQNFSIIIPEFPKLNGKYTKEMLLALAEYAEDRGITIVPEIDIPGHTQVLTTHYPDIFGKHNVLSASEKTFAALERIFTYVHEAFPRSPYIHIGGDEACIGDWEKCEESQQYMQTHGISCIRELYAEYIRRVTEMVFSLGCTPIVWEGFTEEYNDRISKDVIVVAWESMYQTADKLMKSGFKIINASWIPLYIVIGRRHWRPEEILHWDIRFWKNWYPKSAAYPDGFRLPADEGEVLGAQLCSWGDIFPNSDNCEALCEEEFDLVAERMPAFSERTWNAFR